MLAISLAALWMMKSPVNCLPLNEHKLGALIQSVEHSASADQMDTALASLNNYFSSTCATERANLSVAQVAGVARLLRARHARRIVSTMLLDVDAHLDAALPELRAALRDQRAIDQITFHNSGPWRPTTGNQVQNALKCIQEKAVSHRLDRKLCRNLIETR